MKKNQISFKWNKSIYSYRPMLDVNLGETNHSNLLALCTYTTQKKSFSCSTKFKSDNEKSSLNI